MSASDLSRLDRRTAIKWMLAATAAASVTGRLLGKRRLASISREGKISSCKKLPNLQNIYNKLL